MRFSPKRFCSRTTSLLFAAVLAAHGAVVDASIMDESAFKAEKLGAAETAVPFLTVRVSSLYGCRLAYLDAGATLGSVKVVVDGKSDPEYDGIMDRNPVFSEDTKHVAYAARKADQWFVVVDGKIGPKWDMLLENSLVLSEDGKHCAYVAKKERSWFVVLDDKVSPPYEEVGGAPKFSKDGQHVAYAAQNNGKQFVVLDGKPCPEYDGIGAVALSPDGQRLAYAGQQDGLQFVVVDGKKSPGYGGVYFETLQFSADSKHVAYAAERGMNRFVVVDGKNGSDYEGIVRGTLRISGDGSRVAFVARKGEKLVQVIDGKEDPEYDKVEAAFFSENGKRVAYVAGTDLERFLVVDGTPERGFEEIIKDTVVFSKDGGRLAYGVAKKDKYSLMVNGKLSDEYEGMGVPSFSPDGKHLVFRAGISRKSVVFVDGNTVPNYSGIVCEPVFRKDGVLEFLAVEKGSLYRVTNKAFLPAP